MPVNAKINRAIWSPSPDTVIADPMIRPPTKSQNPLEAKPEKIVACGAASMAMKAKKIASAVTVSGRLRVAKEAIPAQAMASTLSAGSDVTMIVPKAKSAAVMASNLLAGRCAITPDPALLPDHQTFLSASR